MKNTLLKKVIPLLCMSVFAHSIFAADISMHDKRFLKNASEAGNFEVEGSNTALKKSQDADIQKFAKMMVDDHTKAGNELKALAAKKGVELPTDPGLVQQGKLKYLGTKDGVKFDRSYISTVGVSGHESAIKLFQDAAEDSKDPDIKKFASDTLPTLKHHLESAQSIDSRVNNDR